MDLQALPNVGPKLAENLRRTGLNDAEAFRSAGAEEAFLRIRAQADPAACFHQLTALAGAEAGIPKKELSLERKAALCAFFDRI